MMCASQSSRHTPCAVRPRPIASESDWQDMAVFATWRTAHRPRPRVHGARHGARCLLTFLALRFASGPRRRSGQGSFVAHAWSLRRGGRDLQAGSGFQCAGRTRLGRLPGVTRQDHRGGRGPSAFGRQAGGHPGPIGPAGLRTRRFCRGLPPCRRDPATPTRGTGCPTGFPGCRASLGPLHPGGTGPHFRPLG